MIIVPVNEAEIGVNSCPAYKMRLSWMRGILGFHLAATFFFLIMSYTFASWRDVFVPRKTNVYFKTIER